MPVCKRPASRMLPGASALGARPFADIRADGPAHPPWAHTCVQALAPLLRQLPTQALTLNIWSDCAGMGVEKLALADLAHEFHRIGLDVSSVHYMFCDNDKASLKFGEANHDPKHMSEDIHNRDFEANTIECIKCEEACHSMPNAGIDIYVNCFPCGPWSARGKRLGFNDAAGRVVFQAIKTINH